MTRIVLAEDHEIVRKGIRALLEKEADFEVVAETGDGNEVEQLVKDHAPDVLVVDLTLTSLDGLEVIRRVRRSVPATRVVVLSMHKVDAYVAQALRHGAQAYVLKESSVGELVTALRTVLDGGHFLSDGVPATIDEGTGRPAAADRYDTLSDREREVLHLVAEGYTSAEVAERLFISVRTVESHRSNIMIKLGLHTQVDLVHYALQRGLIPVGPRTA